VLAVVNGAYLAAVYLAADAARMGEAELERAFRRRALAAGVVAGAVALAGLLVLDGDDHHLFHALLTGDALVAVVCSALAGIATLALVRACRYEPARYGAALAVAAVVAGWALASWPTLLPGLTVERAAAGHETLVAVIIAVAAGGAILFPSLGLLFRLFLAGQLRPAESRPSPAGAAAVGAGRAGSPAVAPSLGRVAAGAFIAGVGLLVFVDAAWAQAVALACLAVFAVLGFLALALGALRDQRADG
jgi:cytochrome d ubiquinol oxidase subunit II